MSLRLSAVVAVGLIAGCQAPGASVQTLEPHALDVAARRMQLDAMCANVTPSVLERGSGRASPATADTSFEYAIGVTGCGQSRTYRVVCPAVGAACFVAPERAS